MTLEKQLEFPFVKECRKEARATVKSETVIRHLDYSFSQIHDPTSADKKAQKYAHNYLEQFPYGTEPKNLLDLFRTYFKLEESGSLFLDLLSGESRISQSQINRILDRCGLEEVTEHSQEQKLHYETLLQLEIAAARGEIHPAVPNLYRIDPLLLCM